MIPPALQLRGLPATAQVFGYNREWPVMLVLHLPICSRVLIVHTAVPCMLLSRVCTTPQTDDACIEPLFTCVLLASACRVPLTVTLMALLLKRARLQPPARSQRHDGGNNETPHPQTQTPNPKPQSPNPKPQTPNPNLQLSPNARCRFGVRWRQRLLAAA
jgi:hypothetical protein